MSVHEGKIYLNCASIVENQYDGTKGIECVGSLQREPESEISVFDYIANNEYIGASIDVESVDKYGYLVFYGKKITDHGQPSVYVINDSGEKIGEIAGSYHDIDNEWHQYVIDITKVKGDIRIVFNGGYVDNTGSADSNYLFSGITLY